MFTEEYAAAYAQIHFEKDYRIEVLNLIKNTQIKKNHHILDFGCGSGNHMQELMSLGYKVEGYDVSTDMISVAKKRGIPDELLHNEFRKIAKRYDLVYSLFDVISYQITEEQLSNYFLQISSILNPGGTIVFDGWHSSGVRLAKPEKRIRTFMLKDLLVDRIVIPFSEGLGSDIYSLRIELVDSLTGRILTSEIHRLRAWSINEIRKNASSFGVVVSEVRDGRLNNQKLSKESWRFMVQMKRN